MKKIYFYLGTLILLWFPTSSLAQIENYYTFSESTASYDPLTGADESVLSPFTFSTVFIPFDFEYAGQKSRNYVIFKNNGSISFGGTSEPQPNDLSEIGQQNSNGATAIIAPLWDNSMNVASGNTIAKRKTLVSGTAPFRTFTIEWEKILWTSEFPANPASEVSFRIILEETTNNITFLYGPNNSTENQSASIGLNTEFGDQISFMSVTPGSPSTVSSSTSNDNISTTNYPGEGTQYVFTYQFPNCRIPSDLDIDNNSLTPSTVDVNWTNAGSETSWDILVINQNDASREVVSANSNPFTLTNLEQDTEYSISIRANCASSDSDYSKPVFFKTLEVCPSPINVNSTNITLDTADFSWQPGDAETNWEATVVLAGDPEPTAGDMVTSTNYSATGLIKDTDYTLYVRSNCGGNGFSKWIAYNFQTLATCQVPTSLTVTEETCNSGTIGWTSNGSETSWEVSVTYIGTETEVIYQADTNPFTINDLNASSTYRFMVRAVCAADDKSRYSSFSFIRTTEDTTNPTPVAQDITVQLGANGLIVLDPNAIDNGSTDDCDIASISLFPSVLTCSDLGENTVTLTVTDTAGNADSTTAIVTVEDNTTPVAKAKDITLQLDANGIAILTSNDINDGSTDNCNIDFVVTPNSFTCAEIGENTVTLSATDASGNADSTTATVTIVDVTLPTANCVAPFSIQLDENGLASITEQDINNNSTDNCGIQSISIDKTNFTSADVGEQVVTLTVTDITGNMNTCSTTVTVEGPTFEVEDYVTGLSTPRGLAFNQDQNLFIAEHTTGKIFEATDVETTTEFASTGFNNNGISFDEDGNLYVAESFLSQILKFDTNVQQSVFLNSSNGISSPWDVKFDSAGNLYVSNFSGNILRITPAGSVSEYATGLFSPEGIAFDSNGNLFVADRNDRKLIRIAPDGSSTTLLTGIIGIRSVAVDASDFVYFDQQVGGGSSATVKIVKYDQNDGSTTDIVDGLDDSNYLLFNRNGDLFISQSDKVSVVREVGEPEVLSVDEVTVNTVLFYPNPVKDRISFITSPSNINIYDISGKRVFTSNTGQNQYDLSELPSGLYFMEAESFSGKRTLQKINKI